MNKKACNLKSLKENKKTWKHFSKNLWQPWLNNRGYIRDRRYSYDLHVFV